MYFTIVEATQNILIYELDVLHIFNINSLSSWDMRIYLIFDLILRIMHA